MMTDKIIPDEVTQPARPPLIGDALAVLGSRIDLTDMDFDLLEQMRHLTESEL